MKKIALAIIIVLTGTWLTACSDNGASDEQPLPDVSAATVTADALAAAVWGASEGSSPDADCLAGSSFTISPEGGFSIVKHYVKLKTGRMDPRVKIISDINISFPDAASDGRGAACGSGALSYAVPATEETPVDIEVAESLKSRQSLDTMARESATPYPKCEITAHFDKAGSVLCNLDEDIVDTPIKPVPGLIAKPINRIIIAKAMEVNEDGVPCGDEEVHSVKLVVDDVNCRTFQPRPINR